MRQFTEAFLFLIIILAAANVTIAASDTSFVAKDDTILYSRVYPDSLLVQTRAFADNELKKLKANPELNYKIPPTQAESLWQRFLQWLVGLFLSLFDNATGTNWGRVAFYIIGFVLLVFIIMMILKVDAFKIFASSTGKIKHQIVEDNIHEMDFEKLLQHAISEKDYRRGVRLLFLYALKLLADRHLINWEIGKTNQEYIHEVSESNLRRGLNELSFYFDYAWYGNFPISEETFLKAQSIFTNWKDKIRQ